MGQSTSHRRADTPEETDLRCAGCRQSLSASDAERVVWNDRVGLMYDMRGGAPGEGLFVHPHPECVRAACWGGFGRMLGREIERPDRDAFVEEISEGLRKRLVERLGDAARAGEAGATVSKVDELLERGGVELVLLAEDASEAARRVARQAERADVPVITVLDAETLSEPLGRDDVEVWAITDADMAERCGLDAEKVVSMQSSVDNG